MASPAPEWHPYLLVEKSDGNGIHIVSIFQMAKVRIWKPANYTLYVAVLSDEEQCWNRLDAGCCSKGLVFSCNL